MICRSRYCIPNRWFLETNVVWWTPFWQGSFTKVLKIIHGLWFWVVRMGGLCIHLPEIGYWWQFARVAREPRSHFWWKIRGQVTIRKRWISFPCSTWSSEQEDATISSIIYKFLVYVPDLPSKQSLQSTIAVLEKKPSCCNHHFESIIWPLSWPKIKRPVAQVSPAKQMENHGNSLNLENIGIRTIF